VRRPPPPVLRARGPGRRARPAARARLGPSRPKPRRRPLAPQPGADDDPSAAALAQDEALELLALSEVIARKAGYGRQLTVRSARRADASWSQIGAALGTSKQAAWEAHSRWIDGQAEQHQRSGYQGLDDAAVAAARALAGEPGSP
jgi:hypothetical protein